MGRKIGFNPTAEDIDDYSEQDTFEIGEAEGLPEDYKAAYIEASVRVQLLQERVEALLRTIEFIMLSEGGDKQN